MTSVNSAPHTCTTRITASHALVYCNSLHRQFTSTNLVSSCPKCGRSHFLCCEHAQLRHWTNVDAPCHAYPVVYIAGSCLRNGSSDSVTGVAMVQGSQIGDKFWIALERHSEIVLGLTSQQAALHAALVAIRRLRKQYTSKPINNHAQIFRGESHGGLDKIILASHSEYLVKGVTQWMNIWRNRDWLNSRGRKPTNLNLFLQIEKEIKRIENECRVQIGFWKIPRAENNLAHNLAKRGAKQADDQ